MSDIDWQAVRERLAETERQLLQKASRSPQDWPELMAERARQLQRRQSAETHAATHLACTLGTQALLLPLNALKAIRPFGDCTPLPGAPPELLGICAFGGQMVSVLDLGRLLDLPAAAQPGPGGYILFLTGQPLIGLRVDQIGESLSPEPVAGPGSSALLSGLTAQGQLVLDPALLPQHPLLQGSYIYKEF